MLLILLLQRAKLEHISVLLSISEELCKSRWMISYQQALTPANKIEKGKQTTVQSCGSDLKMITEENISLRKAGQAKKSTTVAHLSLLLKCITNTCECSMCGLCGSRELCASWWIVVSCGIEQQFVVWFLGHPLALPTKISFACLLTKVLWAEEEIQFYRIWHQRVLGSVNWTHLRVLRNKSGNAHTSQCKTLCFPEHLFV